MYPWGPPRPGPASGSAPGAGAAPGPPQARPGGLSGNTRALGGARCPNPDGARDTGWSQRCTGHQKGTWAAPGRIQATTSLAQEETGQTGKSAQADPGGSRQPRYGALGSPGYRTAL